MLNTLFRPLSLPDIRTISYLDGIGNFAVKKYYKWPYAPFYQKKLRMALDMIGQRKYGRCLDYGSGCGILVPELKKRCDSVVEFEKGNKVDDRWKFELVVCASVLEFTHLDFTLRLLKSLMYPFARLVVASPMDTKLTRAYYKAIGNKHERHSHKTIVEFVKRHFEIEKYEEWNGMYFALKASVA